LTTKLPESITRALRPVLTLFSGQTAQQGIIAAADQGIISITNFASALLLARAVEPTEFGVYAVGFLLLHLLRALQDGLIVQPLSTYGPVMEIGAFRRYATENGVLQVLLAGSSAAAAAVFGWFLTFLGNDTAGPTLFIMWFVFLTWPLQEFIRRCFYSRNQIPKGVVNTITASLIRLGVLVIWASENRLNGQAGLNAIGWGSLIALTLGIWQARQFWTFRKIDVLKTARKNWEFGKWVLGGSLANWGAAELYPLLAAGIISFAAAGAYRALQNLVAPVHVLLRAIDTFLTPRAAWLYHHQGFRGLSRGLRLIYMVSGIPILGLLVLVSLFPEPLLTLLYGETYLPYSEGMALMAVFYILWFAYWPLLAAYKAIRMTRPIFVANIAAIASMFTIGIWAIHKWGVYGAIGGQALNAFIVSAGLWGNWIVVRRR
jgi:O-antigen/teichoic acid export membrane protein